MEKVIISTVSGSMVSEILELVEIIKRMDDGCALTGCSTDEILENMTFADLRPFGLVAIWRGETDSGYEQLIIASEDDVVNEIKIKVTCGAEIGRFLTNFGQILQAAERMEK